MENQEFHPISFLTKQENEVMEHLVAAMELFDQLSVNDPQNPLDTFNFGHYIDAAKSAVILRGARRADPENLLPKRNKPERKTFNEIVDKYRSNHEPLASDQRSEGDLDEFTERD